MIDQDKECDRSVIVIAVLVFAALSIWMAVSSQAFLEADGITHFLARRDALKHPVHLVSVWSRPLCVLLYCVPAYFGGLIGTRLTSLVLVLAMLAMTLRVATQSNVSRPAIVAIALLTQPLLFAHSFAELTEVPFALLVCGMFWAYQTRRFLLLTILAAIGPLGRPEGFGILFVVAFALILHRRWLYLPLLISVLALWSWVGWIVFGGPKDYAWWCWLPHNWPYSSQSQYGRGTPFQFLGVLPAVIGPLAFPFIWIGVWQIISPRTQLVRRFFQDHDYRCRVLIVMIPVSVLIGHSILRGIGRLGSNGEPRYMLIVAPFWALLAAGGYEWFIQRFSLRHPLRWTVLAVLVPITANVLYPVLPLKEQDDDRMARTITAWFQTQTDLRKRYPLFSTALPHLWIEMNLDRIDPTQCVDSSKTIVTHPPAGVMMIWHSSYSTHNSDSEYCFDADLLLRNGWVPIKQWEQRYSTVQVFLSPLDAKSVPTPPADTPK